MTAKELRQSLRRGSFVWPFVGIQVLAVLAMTAEFRMGAAASWYPGPFWIVVGVVCMVIMPLAGLGLMGQELEEGNHELLQLTKLSRWRVVLGKFGALWGLSVLTFVSLLPYVVARYLVGGVEWWTEVGIAVSVLGGAALVGSGCIAASSFRGIGARIGVWVLFHASMGTALSVPLVGSALATDGFSVFFWFTALTGVVAYTLTGLALARAKMRLAYLAYEVKPANLLIGWLIFAPFVCIVFTVFTVGYGGSLGLLLTLVIALRGEGRRGRL